MPKLNNHQLKLVGLSYGLKVRIRVDFTTRLGHPQSGALSSFANNTQTPFNCPFD